MTPGTEIPVVTRTPDSVDLFMFSAASWLVHRIHYDVPFTTEHDGHPGLLIHGPLQGSFMVQAVQRWLGRKARLRSITYRHLSPAYVGDTLDCGGTVADVDGSRVTMELWIRRGDTVTTTGTAVFEVGQ
jgi:hydroxyacyl-ACP dehydratase HTD2-like protein with hotdog domain